MKIWKIMLILCIFWLIFINIFSNYYFSYSEVKNVSSSGSNTDVPIGGSVSLSIEVKRARFFIFPTYIYFYKPVISNNYIYFVFGEIRVLEITIALIILTILIFIWEEILKL